MPWGPGHLAALQQLQQRLQVLAGLGGPRVSLQLCMVPQQLLQQGLQAARQLHVALDLLCHLPTRSALGWWVSLVACMLARTLALTLHATCPAQSTVAPTASLHRWPGSKLRTRWRVWARRYSYCHHGSCTEFQGMRYGAVVNRLAAISVVNAHVHKDQMHQLVRSQLEQATLLSTGCSECSIVRQNVPAKADPSAESSPPPQPPRAPCPACQCCCRWP